LQLETGLLKLENTLKHALLLNDGLSPYIPA